MGVLDGVASKPPWNHLIAVVFLLPVAVHLLYSLGCRRHDLPTLNGSFIYWNKAAEKHSKVTTATTSVLVMLSSVAPTFIVMKSR